MNKTEVELPRPATVGGKEVTAITLTEPTAGQLRGLKLKDVLEMDVKAMIALIPRISSPAMTEAEVAALSPANLTALAGNCVLFFADPKDLAGLG